MIKQIPGGVYPTMVTPFTQDNKIDYNAVEQMLHWYDGKVDGIFAVCQSSEMFFLSFEERLALMRFIREHAPKSMAIVASGHTADSLEQQIEEAKAFIDTGIDSYVFISNRFAAADESDAVFLENVDYVVNRIPEIALGIYECPVPYRRLLSPETLGALAGGGRFTFLKDTCCDADIIRAKIKAVEGTPLKIFNANSASLLQTLRDGAAGSTTGCATTSTKSRKKRTSCRAFSASRRFLSGRSTRPTRSIISRSKGWTSHRSRARRTTA